MKRAISALLALCMILALLPTKVRATEGNAPVPTNLTWTEEGYISFKIPENADLWAYELYRDGVEIDYCNMGIDFGGGGNEEQRIINFCAYYLLDKTGKYTIKIRVRYPLSGSGPTSEWSDWVSSSPFQYTHPGVSLELPTNLAVNDNGIVTSIPSEKNLAYYGSYYTRLYRKNDTGEWFEFVCCTTPFQWEESGKEDSLLDRDIKPGLYGITIQAISNNIDLIGHSEESEMVIFNYDGSAILTETAPPTNLRWNNSGGLSFDLPEDCATVLAVIHRDGQLIYNSYYDPQDLSKGYGYPHLVVSNWIDKSGSYTVTLEAYYETEDDPHYFGGSATSEPFQYTHPGVSLQLPKGLSIGKDYIPTWTANDTNLNYPGTYDITLYFKRDGTDAWFNRGGQSVLFTDDSGFDFFNKLLLQDYQNGYSGPYGVTIRAVSGNINMVGHSEESEMVIFNYDGSLDPAPSKTPLTRSMFTVDTADETYTGQAITKTITSSLIQGTDYTVSYANNVNVGTATITITGKGNYSGTVTYTFTISKVDTLRFTIARSSITLVKGATAKPDTRVSLDGASITWKSSNTSVATVAADGTVTGTGIGKAIITGTASCQGQTKTASYMVNVTSDVSVAFKERAIFAKTEGDALLTYTYRPADATVTVTSSDPSVVEVTAPLSTSGRGAVGVKAVKGGTATVTVTVAKDGVTKTDTCTVTVPSTTEEIAKKFVDMAVSQGGNRADAYGWQGKAWCARFIYWCANRAGISTIIPEGGAMAEHVCGKIVQANGNAVYFDDVTAYEKYPILTKGNFLTDNATKVKRDSYDPQIGDIVFFRQSLTEYINSDKHVSHVGIVRNIDGNNIYVVHGNWGNKVQTNTLFYRDGSDSKQGAVIIGYARPKWSNVATPVRGRMTITFHCPINVRYSYDGEVLDSATGQLEASFGTMEVNEAEESITVTLNDYYHVDAEITGTGEGTMNLTATFEDEDGTTSTRSFQNVPISSDTLGKLYSTDSVSTAYLELYENEGEDFVEVWTAGQNETATERDQDLTDWYKSDNDFGDEPKRSSSYFPVDTSLNTYAVALPTGLEHGKVTASAKTARQGDTVTLTPVPDEGYTLDSLTVTDSEGQSLSLTEEDGKFTFTMPAFKVTIAAAFVEQAPPVEPAPAEPPFTDIAPTAWYYDDVAYVYQHGLMNGTKKDQLFSPEAPMTRAMLMTVLARYDGVDTAGGETWYSKALAWAVEKGVSSGEQPQENVTREQLVTMLWRYAGRPEAGQGLDGFSDADAVSRYAQSALSWAVETGVLTGKTGNRLDPKGSATRAEVAAILARYCQGAEAET